MVVNIEDLNEIIIGRVEPHIYAFSTNTIPNYLKVGDTYRPVSIRLKEWKKYYPELEEQFQNTAKIDENTYFRDYSIHKYLEDELRKERLKPEDIDHSVYYSNEFFKDATKNDIENAIEDIKKDYSQRGEKYSYYNAETMLPTQVRYSSTGYWNPRPNQQDAINAFKHAVDIGRNNLLMYAVMRFGKSFTSMCCAKEINANFVIVVSAKADVKDEWRKTVECADNFRNDYEFMSSEDLARNHSVVIDALSSDKKIVLFLTLQDLQGDIIKDKHRQVFGQQIDLLIIDETHFGARADKYGQVLKDPVFKGEKCHKKDADDYIETNDAEEAIKVLDAKIKLHLSGTPYRILMGGEFKKEDIIAFCQFSDIVQAQEQWDKENLLKDEDENSTPLREWDNPYYGFPQMIRFAFNPNDSTRKKLEELSNLGVKYTLSALLKPLSVKKTEDNLHKKFKYEQEVLDLLQIIDGSKEDENILGFLDYDKIKSGKMCRHIVFVLPFCASCDALEALIKENAGIFKNLNEYEIINISGIENANLYNSPKTIKDKIKQLEKENKKTITLTVNRMLTGSTVEEWDTMIYLKDTASPQEYDQAVFRLQNQYIKTFKDKNGDNIKFNMKPQTLLVDFSPNRMFQMQEQKAQIYNVNIDEAGNSKLKDRIEEELRISPIIVINKSKIAQVQASDILDAVSRYSMNRGVAEETNDIPVDLDLIKISEIWDTISKENELGSKSGFESKAIEGEGDELDIPDGDDNGNNETDTSSTDTNGESNETSESDGGNKKDPVKQFRMYYARILYYAFLTNEQVYSIDSIIGSLDNEDNKRIFRNLGLDVNVVEALKNNMDKFMLRILDYKIQNLNKLSNESNLEPLERANVANQKFGKIGESEVVTPQVLTEKVISLFSDEYMHQCIEQHKLFLDIAAKEAEFAIALYKRFKALGYNLEDYKDLIYSIPTSNITYEFTRKIYEILGLNVDNIATKFNSYDLLKFKNEENIDYKNINAIFNQDKLFSQISLEDISKIPEGENNDMKFDTIVGNPPYQEIISKTTGNKSLGKQLFPGFMITAMNLASKYISFITPSKWFTSEAQDHSFVSLREYIRQNNHFSKIFHFSNNEGVFDDVAIGAINYFLYDKEYEGNVEFHNCTLDVDNDIVSRPLFENNIDIIISLNSMVSIINKVRSHSGFVSFMTITKGRNAFNVVGNKKTLHEISTNKNFQGAVSLFCAYEEIRYINRDYITKNIDLIDKWKVFISKANGGAGTLSPNNSVAILGKPYIGIPNSICTDSLIPIGGYDNKFEAQNLQKYMQTKFLRFIVGILKVSQNLYQNVYQLVPLQDFTKDSDINWAESISKIDKQLYLKYGLSEEEINYIESMIKPME